MDLWSGNCTELRSELFGAGKEDVCDRSYFWKPISVPGAFSVTFHFE
jgi:hypothetical protein